MKKFITLLFISIIYLTSNGCSHYIHRIHQEFDKKLNNRSKARKKDTFSLYRKNKHYRQNISTRNLRNISPTIKRRYTPTARKRYKADDLNDNQYDGSLWSGQKGNDQFLFTKNNYKSSGDIVLVQVYGKLKNEITAELKRAYPNPKNKQKNRIPSSSKKTDKPAGQASAGQPKESDQTAPENDQKAYDRISSVVVEEINRDHILLRGRKNLLYQNRKRLIELQALISRKDILDDDTVSSNRIIESSITVIK